MHNSLNSTTIKPIISQNNTSFSQSLTSSSSRPSQITFSGFDGIPEEEIHQTFLKYGKTDKFQITGRGEGTVTYIFPSSCLVAKKFPPQFDDRIIHINYTINTQKDIPFNEIVDEEDFISLYVSYDNSIEEKLGEIEANTGLAKIQTVNNIVIPKYTFLNAFLLHYYSHDDAQRALNILTENQIKCRPASLWL